MSRPSSVGAESPPHWQLHPAGRGAAWSNASAQDQGDRRGVRSGLERRSQRSQQVRMPPECCSLREGTRPMSQAGGCWDSIVAGDVLELILDEVVMSVLVL